MRFTPATLALAALFATVSSAGISQGPDTAIAPLSIEWKAAGDQARAAGKADDAIDAYESSVAADPRNRAAFVALGAVLRERGLPGKAIHYYAEALLIDPTDMAALGGQGAAMADKGAIAQAKATLAKMQSICRSNCPEIGQLSVAINQAVAKGQVSEKAPVPSPAPDAKAEAKP